MKAVKVRKSLCTWGYINSDSCASSPRRETIDHCFLNCVNFLFLCFRHFWGPLPPPPLLFRIVSVLFFQFSLCPIRHRAIIIFIIKSILYGIWKFHNKATFHNGTESSHAIILYVIQDITSHVKLDQHRLPASRFKSVWVHPEFCLVASNTRLVFPFVNR